MLFAAHIVDFLQAYATAEVAAGHDSADSRSFASEMLEEYHKAVAAVQPLKRLLPEMWCLRMAGMATVVQRSRAQLEQAAPANPQQRAAFDKDVVVPKCRGCGKAALGLRKCARCREAGYCR